MTVYNTASFVKKNPQKAWEECPFVYDGKLYKAGFRRQWAGTSGLEIVISEYDDDKDVFWVVARIPWTRLLGCILSDDDGRIYAFGTTNTGAGGNAIKRQEIDPATWTFTGPECHVHTAPSHVRIYNTSVCKRHDSTGHDRYVLVYEVNEGNVPFSARFLKSPDLVTWTPFGALMRPESYAACPTIRYVKDGWFMLTWLWHNVHNGQSYWITNIGRTQDFQSFPSWTGAPHLSSATQVLSPMDTPYEGRNNSDCDFVEYNGRVYFTYFTGDQATWAVNSDAWYDGTLEQFYHEWWP